MTITSGSRTRVAVLAAALATVPAVALAQQNDRAEGFNVAPTGYVQFDVRTFPGWDVTPDTGGLNRGTVELRRLRGALEGNWKKVVFEVSVDPLDDDGIFVKDAYGQVRFSRRLRLRVGQFKVPGTRDYDQSARRLDFLERSALTTTIGVGRDIGARLDGRAGRVTYEAGLFAGDGIGRNDRANLTAAGRVVWQVVKNLEIGGSASEARTRAVDSEPANGSSFRSPAGYRFAEGVYVQGRRARLGADVEWSPGDWRVTGEMLRLTDQRHEQGLDLEDLPDAVGTGFSTSIRRKLGTRFETAFRYDYLGFDDVAAATSLDSVRPRATDIRARANHAYTAAGTWTLSRWLRLVGNASTERYAEARSAPEPGNKGSYFTGAVRLQMELR